MPRSALIFDFDGTIAPSEEAVFDVWSDFFAGRGLELPLEVWSRCVGTSEETVDLAAYAEAQGLGERAEIRSRLNAAVAERCATLPMNPGVEDLISQAASDGFSLGIASSSPSSWVVGHLERLGIHRHFASIRTRDHGPTKPSPFLYRQVLTDLAAETGTSWAVEDSGPGVSAAKAAGLSVIAVPNTITRTHDLSAADLIVDSLAEVTVAHLKSA